MLNENIKKLEKIYNTYKNSPDFKDRYLIWTILEHLELEGTFMDYISSVESNTQDVSAAISSVDPYYEESLQSLLEDEERDYEDDASYCAGL